MPRWNNEGDRIIADYLARRDSLPNHVPHDRKEGDRLIAEYLAERNESNDRAAGMAGYPGGGMSRYPGGGGGGGGLPGYPRRLEENVYDGPHPRSVHQGISHRLEHNHQNNIRVDQINVHLHGSSRNSSGHGGGGGGGDRRGGGGYPSGGSGTGMTLRDRFRYRSSRRESSMGGGGGSRFDGIYRAPRLDNMEGGSRSGGRSWFGGRGRRDSRTGPYMPSSTRGVFGDSMAGGASQRSSSRPERQGHEREYYGSRHLGGEDDSTGVERRSFRSRFGGLTRRSGRPNLREVELQAGRGGPVYARPLSPLGSSRAIEYPGGSSRRARSEVPGGPSRFDSIRDGVGSVFSRFGRSGRPAHPPSMVPEPPSHISHRRSASARPSSSRSGSIWVLPNSSRSSSRHGSSRRSSRHGSERSFGHGYYGPDERRSRSHSRAGSHRSSRDSEDLYSSSRPPSRSRSRVPAAGVSGFQPTARAPSRDRSHPRTRGTSRDDFPSSNTGIYGYNTGPPRSHRQGHGRWRR